MVFPFMLGALGLGIGAFGAYHLYLKPRGGLETQLSNWWSGTGWYQPSSGLYLPPAPSPPAYPLLPPPAFLAPPPLDPGIAYNYNLGDSLAVKQKEQVFTAMQPVVINNAIDVLAQQIYFLKLGQRPFFTDSRMDKIRDRIRKALRKRNKHKIHGKFFNDFTDLGLTFQNNSSSVILSQSLNSAARAFINIEEVDPEIQTSIISNASGTHFSQTTAI